LDHDDVTWDSKGESSRKQKRNKEEDEAREFYSRSRS
jgi:hypothetical protein